MQDHNGVQAIHRIKDAGTDVVANLITKHKVDPRSKSKVCEMLPFFAKMY